MKAPHPGLSPENVYGGGPNLHLGGGVQKLCEFGMVKNQKKIAEIMALWGRRGPPPPPRQWQRPWYPPILVSMKYLQAPKLARL